MNHNLIDLLKNINKTHDSKYISSYLNISLGTLNRWFEKNQVPDNYTFDIYKLCNIDIDYSRFTSKQKDQFYTPETTAKYCFDKFKTLIKNYNDDYTKYIYIEPSAGSGNFLKILPKNSIGLDIEPKGQNILKTDYLEWKPSNKNQKYITFGNPPFGLRGQLALKFINHSYDFSDYVCFILPQLFESDGKGVPRKRVKGFNLIHSEKLDSKFIDPDNNQMTINCIFQIWSKYHQNPQYNTIENNPDIKVYSLSNGDKPSQIRNKNMIDKCDIYLPSTCFGIENMKNYSSFYDLPNQRGYGLIFLNHRNDYLQKAQNINWSTIAFLSTNSAYNLRTSQIIQAFNK